MYSEQGGGLLWINDGRVFINNKNGERGSFLRVLDLNKMGVFFDGRKCRIRILSQTHRQKTLNHTFDSL